MLKDRTPIPLRAVEKSERAYVVAIDLGTGGPKVAVLDKEGRVVAHAFRPVTLHLPPGGGAEQDPNVWWQAIVDAGREALNESGVTPIEVIGIGATSQWVGTVPVDKGGQAIGNSIIWMDSRGANAVRKKVGNSPKIMGYNMWFLLRSIRMTGGVPSLSGKDPLGHILFLEEQRPEVFKETTKFLEPVDYLNLRLTGVARASYDSITVHWITDNRKINAVKYDTKLIRRVGLNRNQLPDLLATGDVVGGLSEEAASALGLVAGTPVITGCGDIHSAAIGSGAVGDFSGHIYIGTSSWISCHVPFKKVSPSTNVTSIPAALPGKYLVADEHETGGACLTWLRDNVICAQDLMTDGDKGAPQDAFYRMNTIANEVPAGANGVLFTPWLNGERTPVDDHTIRAGFHNLSLSNDRKDMIRAVFEGVAFNSNWLLGAVEKFTGRPFGSLAFIGGGANSDLWSQIHADVLQRPIKQVSDPVLANVRGAGFLTLLALGAIDVEKMEKMVDIKATFTPDPAMKNVYREHYESFVELYKNTKGIHRHLNHKKISG